MIRQSSWLASALAMVLVLGVASAAFGLPDDELPGVQLPASPVGGSFSTAGNVRDVYRVSLRAGETLEISLTTPTVSGCDLDLYLYGPGTLAGAVDHNGAIVRSAGPMTAYPETIRYTAARDGDHYIEVFTAEGSGSGILTWSILPEPLLPVYRFYNVQTGTHFYTQSLDEKNTVISRWSNVFSFEGVAYSTKATRNSQPLYRFYNNRNGSHFYTASVAERDAVITQWSGVFTYEGETYKVSPAGDPGKTPVYRFYNMNNGSHFFTASLDEANAVIAKWSNVYQFEGPAFSLGQ